MSNPTDLIQRLREEGWPDAADALESQQARIRTLTEALREIPPELFDGMAVYVELGLEKTERIRPDMVSDILDAVVKLIRKRQREERESG